jgi:hypothetical protein
MKVKIKIKNQLESKNNPFIGGFNWKKKDKGQINQKYNVQIRKQITKNNKLGLKGEIKNNQNLNKRAKEKKIEIKRRRTKLKNINMTN